MAARNLTCMPRLPGVFLAIGALLLLQTDGLLAGSDQPARDKSTVGQQVYRRACATCHGLTGNGAGPAARYLDPLPRDFTMGTYKFRSTTAGQLPSDDDLYRTITRGVPGTMMPAFRNALNEQDRREVAGYIKIFSPMFLTLPQGEPIEIPEPTEVSERAVQEGRHIYMTLSCWTCHGSQGRGDGVAASGLIDVWGHDVRPPDLTSPYFKGGNAPEDVFRSIVTGFSGTPMPSFAESFRFARDDFRSDSAYDGIFSASEVATLNTYLSSQPSREEWDSLTDTEAKALMNRRKWALAHYVKSLSLKRGLVHALFVQDTEVTK